MRSLALAGCVLAIPAGVSAQRTIAPSACAFDTASHRDSAVIVLSISAFRRGDTLPDAEITAALGAMIRERFHPPASIATLFFPNTSPPKDAPVVQVASSGVLYGRLVLAVEPDGRFADIDWIDPTYDAATNDEFVKTLRELGGSEGGALLPTMLGRSDRALVLRLTSAGATGSVPLIRLRVPTIRIDTPPSAVSAPAPKYPPQLRARGEQGVVRVQFVIGTGGEIVPNSLRVIAATNALFANAAVAAIEQEISRPAQAGGCAVPFLVTQDVRFSIRR